MKHICVLLAMAGLTAVGANAQTVTGSGTTNKIPKFTGSSTIGDSHKQRDRKMNQHDVLCMLRENCCFYVERVHDCSSLIGR